MTCGGGLPGRRREGELARSRPDSTCGRLEARYRVDTPARCASLPRIWIMRSRPFARTSTVRTVGTRTSSEGTSSSWSSTTKSSGSQPIPRRGMPPCGMAETAASPKMNWTSRPERSQEPRRSSACGSLSGAELGTSTLLETSMRSRCMWESVAGSRARSPSVRNEARSDHASPGHSTWSASRRSMSPGECPHSVK
jgi:hypothetical protein